MCRAQSFIHNFVTHNLSNTHAHTTLSRPIFHTQLGHTHTHNSSHTALLHTNLSRNSCAYSPALSHNLSSTISFIFPAFAIPFWHLFCAYYWKKLTYGVFWLFNFAVRVWQKLKATSLPQCFWGFSLSSWACEGCDKSSCNVSDGSTGFLLEIPLFGRGIFYVSDFAFGCFALVNPSSFHLLCFCGLVQVAPKNIQRLAI